MGGKLDRRCYQRNMSNKMRQIESTPRESQRRKWGYCLCRLNVSNKSAPKMR
jgi:hypothetical protein